MYTVKCLDRSFAALRLCVSLSLALGCLAGCGSGSSGPALAAVSGAVTLKGKPFAGANVRFIPQGDTLGHGGAGKTDAAGRYEIIANRSENRKGLLPGEYKVVVSRLLMPDGTPLPPNVPPIDSGARESVPTAYAKPHLTPLTVTIGTETKTYDVSLDEGK
jgi:hypothetical protein